MSSSAALTPLVLPPAAPRSASSATSSGVGAAEPCGGRGGNGAGEAARATEVNVAVRGDAGGQMADLIDGAIGEASMFHDTFGYYAQGVVETTAVLPEGS